MKSPGGWTFVTLAFTLSASVVFAQTHLDSVNVKTRIKTGPITATDGAKIHLSSIDINGGSQISGGNLDVDSKLTMGSITAKGQDTEVNLGSLLLNDGSQVGSLNGKLKTSVDAGEVVADEGAKVDAGGVRLSNSQIGSLTVDGKIKVEADSLTAQEGALLGVASLIIENSKADSIHIDKMKAKVQNVTVEEGGQAYFSTIKLADGATAGDIRFESSTKVNSDVTVKAGTLLNVGSIVSNGAKVGSMSADYNVKVHDIDMSDESEVVIGGANF